MPNLRAGIMPILFGPVRLSALFANLRYPAGINEARSAFETSRRVTITLDLLRLDVEHINGR